jgi:hypothetical protein
LPPTSHSIKYYLPPTCHLLSDTAYAEIDTLSDNPQKQCHNETLGVTVQGYETIGTREREERYKVGVNNRDRIPWKGLKGWVGKMMMKIRDFPSNPYYVVTG